MAAAVPGSAGGDGDQVPADGRGPWPSRRAGRLAPRRRDGRAAIQALLQRQDPAPAAPLTAHHLGDQNVSAPLLMAISVHKRLATLQPYVKPSQAAVAALMAASDPDSRGR